MSINDATPEMWDRLKTKYKALVEEEQLEMENDEWLKECFHYISEFKARFVDEGARLKQDFFFEEERYQRFLDLTMEIAKNVENVGFGPC